MILEYTSTKLDNFWLYLKSKKPATREHRILRKYIYIYVYLVAATEISDDEVHIFRSLPGSN